MSSSFYSIQKVFKRKGINISIYLVLILILINFILTYQYKTALNRNHEYQEKYEIIKFNKDNILVNLNNIDMSVRGYLLVENEAFIDTYNKIKMNAVGEFKLLNNLLPEIGFDVAKMAKIQSEVENYFKIMEHVIKLHTEGNAEEALKIIKEDYGTDVWLNYVEFNKVIDPYLNDKIKTSQDNYEMLLDINMIFNSLLFILGVPTLFFAGYRLSRNARKRAILYNELDQNNRNLIFDSNISIDLDDEKSLVGEIIKNLKKTASYIKEISKGDYEVKWEGLTEENTKFNKNNIAGELISMRDKMKIRQEEDNQKNWVREGIAKLSDVIRDNQNDFKLLLDKTISFIVNYLSAQQGGFYLVHKDEEKKFIELSSCYAFNRKKFIDKKIEIGQGLVGQAYLEAEPIYLSEIPQDYISISSGLGDAKPTFLLVYPLKHNEEVVAIIELASFKKFNSFAMDFLEIASKTIASSISTIQINQKTQELLEKSQKQTEMMLAQEEEMRQNMEELEATQEEMKRKEIELKKLFETYENAESATKNDL